MDLVDIVDMHMYIYHAIHNNIPTYYLSTIIDLDFSPNPKEETLFLQNPTYPIQTFGMFTCVASSIHDENVDDMSRMLEWLFNGTYTLEYIYINLYMNGRPW